MAERFDSKGNKSLTKGSSEDKAKMILNNHKETPFSWLIRVLKGVLVGIGAILPGIIPFWSIQAHLRLLICKILQICSAESFSSFFTLFVMAHPLPLPSLPCGLVVGGGGEVIDEVGFADQPFSSVGICDELALVDRRVDAVFAHVDQP
jgi:hypothetical protein